MKATAPRAGSGALRQRLLTLREASLRINEVLEFDEVLTAVLDTARQLIDAPSGVICVVDEPGQLQRLEASGMNLEQRQALSEPGGVELFEHFSQLSEPLMVPDLAAYLASHGLAQCEPSAVGHSCWAAPIRTGRRAVGCLLLANAPTTQQFGDEDAATLAMFASHAALAIVNALRYRDEQWAREELETAIETSPVGVLVFDMPSGDPVRANREALRIVADLHGPDEKPVRLLRLIRVQRADGRVVSLSELPLAQALAAGETVRTERIVLVRPGWPRVPVLINATPIRSARGGIESIVVTMQDTSPLEELDRLRSDCLGLASEQLRSPLVAVKGAVATLLESPQTLEPVEAVQLLRLIDTQTTQMRAIIGDLVDLARIQAGTLPIQVEPAEVARLVDAATSAPADVSGCDRVETNVAAGLPFVMADRRRVVQVLNRIVSIASELSNGSAPVRVSARRDGDHVQVAVTLPEGTMPERLERLLTTIPPRLGDDISRSCGEGLVLAMCRGIVEAHGGRLWVQADGAGAAVRLALTLPAARPESVLPSQTPDPSGTQSGTSGHAAQIVAVAHDPLEQRHIQDTLSEGGYRVTVAADIDQMWSLVDSHRPDLVLVCLETPDADSVKTTAALRARSDAPVIFLAGYGQSDAVLHAMEAGAADYIIKPFSRAELVARVTAALRPLPAVRNTDGEFSVGDLTIEYASRTVTVAGRPVVLSRIEYQLLCELSCDTGRTLSHDQLIRRVWRSASAGPGAVRSAVKRLRRKLGDQATDPAYIITVPDVGYRIGTSAQRVEPL